MQPAAGWIGTGVFLKCLDSLAKGKGQTGLQRMLAGMGLRERV